MLKNEGVMMDAGFFRHFFVCVFLLKFSLMKFQLASGDLPSRGSADHLKSTILKTGMRLVVWAQLYD